MLTVLLYITYLAAVCMSLYTAGWLLAKAEKNRITCAFIVCQLLIVIWCTPQLFQNVPDSRAGLYLAYGISYVGICFIGPAWLVFSLLYSKKRISAWVLALLAAVSSVHYALLMTNDRHFLFYSRFDVGNVAYGPVFYVHMAYTYLCVAAGIAVIAVGFHKNRVRLLNRVMILASAAVPLAFNLLYVTGVVKLGFDLTPPAFAVSSLLMVLAVYRYDLLDVNPMAFSRILAEVEEGVLVYNERGKITYANGSARAWFGVETGENVERFWKISGIEQAELQQAALQQAAFQQAALQQAAFQQAPESVKPAEHNPVMAMLPDGRRLEIRLYSNRNKSGRLLAGTVLITDVSRYYELMERDRELAVSNQSLALERERNRIAQEVHDTTGHTLTMINSLIKMARIGYEKGDGAVLEYLIQGEGLAVSGLRELRCSIHNLKEAAPGGLVTQGVRHLAESMREFEVEVSVQGTDGPEYSYLSPVICRCFKEALTNCIKYADATHVDAILKFTGDSLNFYIFDNGRGCGKIRRGNGLNGIYRRVEEAGGSVRMFSEVDGGFQITIQLPVKR